MAADRGTVDSGLVERIISVIALVDVVVVIIQVYRATSESLLKGKAQYS
jgi:hypothetical protein